MTGEPTHTASKERMVPELIFSSEHMPQISKTASKVQWPLHFAFSYVQALQIKTVEEEPLQQSSHLKILRFTCPNYQLLPRKCSVYTLHFQLCSAHYTALQMKNSCKIISAISPFTMDYIDDSHLQTYCREAMYRITMNRHLGLSAKRNGTQKRTKVSP